MKFLLLISVFMCSFFVKGQEVDSVNTDSLKFELTIFPIIDIETQELLNNVDIKIIGTDGTLREYTSDSLGIFPIIELKSNTSYLIVVSKDKYLIAKGKETTVGETTSKRYLHEYALQKLFICRGRPPIISYNLNSLQPFSEEEDNDLTNIYYDILTENPTIVMQIHGFRDESEKKKISKQRAESYKNQLVKMGINKKRLVINDGGVGKSEDAQENRSTRLKVIRDDFESE